MRPYRHILFITPPFTQLNTPYPATSYLRGFLNTLDISSDHADLGLDVILEIFSGPGLQQLFDSVSPLQEWSDNARRIYHLQQAYIETITPVIAFLQGRNDAFAYNICNEGFLPQAGRFENMTDLEYAFGSLGILDKAKYIATMYLEDLGDFITECVDEHFGFSRYAERLAQSAHSFDELYNELHLPPTYTDSIITTITDRYIKQYDPQIIGLSIPFPGNLYGGLRAARYIKSRYPEIRIVMGGGYVNTELRSIKDKRFFEFVDFLTLDDGERPLECLMRYLNGDLPVELLKRTFTLDSNGEVTYFNGSLLPDYKQELTGTPDYRGLPLEAYISVIEVANPMHKLWSDGRWNKLTLAHGCYWGKCTFCDIHLDYIGNYEATTAKALADKIETIISQTGTTGFHFVDEAAPPALMKQLALELLRRKVRITWWTNIRFEKSFTEDLCLLLAASGCIAVSGGLEVASDRLLKLIDKGVTVAQVAKVADNLTSAGIFVHAYLMYGFPTQTMQETIDALEHVRQLFEANVIQSGYWHRFAMTAHSPIGKNPAAFKVKALCGTDMPFANNDLPHEDPEGCDHEMFSEGLRASLFNYMNGIGTDFPLQDWFDFKIPRPAVPPQAVRQYINDRTERRPQPNHMIVWTGSLPVKQAYVSKRKGKSIESYCLVFYTSTETYTLKLESKQLDFIYAIFPRLVIGKDTPLSWLQFKTAYEDALGEDIMLLWNHPEWQKLRNRGLLLL